MPGAQDVSREAPAWWRFSKRSWKKSRRREKALAFEAGCLWGAAILAWASAVADIDSVRACEHCGIAPTLSTRVYCEHTMCDPAECFYWICRSCFDKGLRHEPAPRQSEQP